MESSPQAIYRAEKDKALRERRITHLQLMQEAQEAFRKMLADAQLARKGGRPKSANTAAKKPATKSVADAVEVTVTAAPAAPAKPVRQAAANPAPARAASKHAPAKKSSPVVAKRHAAKSSPARAAHKRAEPAAKAAPRRAAAPKTKQKVVASKSARTRTAGKRR